MQLFGRAAQIGGALLGESEATCGGRGLPLCIGLVLLQRSGSNLRGVDLKLEIVKTT